MQLKGVTEGGGLRAARVRVFEAFPVDVWIRRIVAETYLSDLAGRSCTPAEYERIRRFSRDYFGEYAGYAQEYLYCARGPASRAGAP